MSVKIAGYDQMKQQSRGRRLSSPSTHRRVPAVTRSIAILRLLGKTDAPLGVNAIATALNLIPSTCLHILRVLVHEGLVAVSKDNKLYRLDVGVVALARSSLSRSGINAQLQPVLDRLVERYPVTSVAVRPVRLEYIVVVAISGSQLEGRIHVEIGARFPALMSATGRCVAAFGGHSANQIREQFEKVRWDRPPSVKEWNADVKAARKRHYSVDKDQYISGITVIASPILDSSARLTHVLVIVGVTKQVQKVGITKIADDLRIEAERLSAEFYL
jgi:DNA-binding IclR family transcriptional regulator